MSKKPPITLLKPPPVLNDLAAEQFVTGLPAQPLPAPVAQAETQPPAPRQAPPTVSQEPKAVQPAPVQAKPLEAPAPQAKAPARRQPKKVLSEDDIPSFRRKGTSSILYTRRQGPKQRISAYLPLEITKALAQICAERDLDLSEAVTQAVENWVAVGQGN